MRNGAAVPGPLAQIRQATAALHQQLDGSLSLMDDDLDRATYTALVARFHGFWRSWQPQVRALLDDDALVKPRQRLALLTSDLTALGYAPAAIDALPECPRIDLRTPAEALGSLYVLEGATLGGQVIRRHVERRLGLNAASGCAYFAGYGPETGRMWREFLTRIEAVSPGDVAQVVRGAVRTFEGVLEWLSHIPEP